MRNRLSERSGSDSEDLYDDNTAERLSIEDGKVCEDENNPSAPEHQGHHPKPLHSSRSCATSTTTQIATAGAEPAAEEDSARVSEQSTAEVIDDGAFSSTKNGGNETANEDTTCPTTSTTKSSSSDLDTCSHDDDEIIGDRKSVSSTGSSLRSAEDIHAMVRPEATTDDEQSLFGNTLLASGAVPAAISDNLPDVTASTPEGGRATRSNSKSTALTEAQLQVVQEQLNNGRQGLQVGAVSCFNSNNYEDPMNNNNHPQSCAPQRHDPAFVSEMMRGGENRIQTTASRTNCLFSSASQVGRTRSASSKRSKYTNKFGITIGGVDHAAVGSSRAAGNGDGTTVVGVQINSSSRKNKTPAWATPTNRSSYVPKIMPYRYSRSASGSKSSSKSNTPKSFTAQRQTSGGCSNSTIMGGGSTEARQPENQSSSWTSSLWSKFSSQFAATTKENTTQHESADVITTTFDQYATDSTKAPTTVFSSSGSSSSSSSSSVNRGALVSRGQYKAHHRSRPANKFEHQFATSTSMLHYFKQQVIGRDSSSSGRDSWSSSTSSQESCTAHQNRKRADGQAFAPGGPSEFDPPSSSASSSSSSSSSCASNSSNAEEMQQLTGNEETEIDEHELFTPRTAARFRGRVREKANQLGGNKKQKTVGAMVGNVVRFTPHCGRVLSDTSTSSTESCAAGGEHRSTKDAGVLKNADCSGAGGRGILMPSGRAAAYGEGDPADDEAEDEAGKMQSKPPTVESLTPRIKNISESRRQQLQEIIKAGQSLKELKKRNHGNETSSTALKGGYSTLGTTMTGASPTSGRGGAAGRDSSEMGVMHQHGNTSSANGNATTPHMPRTKTLSTDGDRSCRNKNSISLSGLQMTPKSSMKESDSVSCHHSNSSSHQYKDFSNGGSTSTSPRYTMSNRTNSNCNTNSTSGSTTEVVVIRQNPDGTTQQEVVTQPRVKKIQMLAGASSPSGCTQDLRQEERNAVAVSAQELNPVGRKPGATNSKHEDASTEPTRTPRSNSTARFRDLESSSSCSSVQDQTPVNSQIAVYTTGLGCAGVAGGLQHPGMGMMVNNSTHVEVAPGMQMVHQMHNLHMHHSSAGMNFGMNAGVGSSSQHPHPHGHGQQHQHQHHSHSDYLDESPMSVLSQQSNRPPHVVEHFVKKASSFFGVNAPATMLTSAAGGGSRTTGTSHMQQQVVDPLPTSNSVDETRSAGPDLLRTPTPVSKKSNLSSRVQQQESVELFDRPSPQTARPAKQVRGSGKGINSCCSTSPKSGAKSISNGSTSGVRRVLLSNEHQHDTERHHNSVPLKQAPTPQQLSAENIRQWESINKSQTVHQQQMQLQKNHQNANSSVTRKLTSRSLQNLNLQQGGTRAIGLNHARIAMAVDRADKTTAAQLNMNPRGMLMNAAGGSTTSAPNCGAGAGATGSSTCGMNRFQQCGSSSGSQSCPHHRSATLGRHINPTHGAHQLHNRNDFRNRQQLLSSINEDDYSSSDDFSKQGENTTCSQKLQAKSPNSLRKQCRSQTAGACCPGGGSGSSSSTSGKNGKSNANGAKPGSSSASCNPHDSTTTRRGSRAASRSSSERSSFAVCFSDSSHRDSLLRDLDEVDSRRSGETGRDNLLVHHGNQQNMANCALPPPKIISSAANSKENNAGNHGATTSSSKRIHHLGGHKHESKKHRSDLPKGTTPPSCRGVAPALCSSANLGTKMRVGGMSFVPPPRGRSGLVADDGGGHHEMMQMISTTTTSTSHHGFPRGVVPSGVKQKGSAATEFLFV
ncbi:unnamed protein product [Amoebophrya sp. A120]|nr:unnamed protein product [Amoebophrya sp. A120]|eukprot:GSA120T00009680001.1